MARIRSVKPEYWLDRKLARGASRDARLLYIGLWNYADEHGRLHGDPAVIKGQIFPYDDVDIVELLDELAALGRVQPYEFEGDPYLYLPMLAKHQRLEPAKSASRLPAPPERDPDPNPPSSKAHSEKTAAESELIAGESEPFVVQQVAGSRLHVAGSRLHGPVDGADKSAQDDDTAGPSDDYVEQLTATIKALRPAWSPTLIAAAIRKKRREGIGPHRLTLALAIVATDPTSEVPQRIHAAGYWWDENDTRYQAALDRPALAAFLERKTA